MKQGVTFIGTLLVDFIKMIDEYPPAGNLCNMGEISRCVGGLAANTAIDLKVIDPSLYVGVMGLVGQDDSGRYIRDTIASYGVDVSGIVTHPSLPTSFTDVMTVQSTGIRTFFQQQGANAAFGWDEVDFAAIESRHVHLGYALLLNGMDAPDDQYGTVMARVLHRMVEMGLETSIDLVSETGERYQTVVAPSLPYVDTLFMNEVEAASTTGIEVYEEQQISHQAMGEVCARLLEMGVRKRVVVHAPQGGWMLCREDASFTFAPSLALPQSYIQGTVGAGDAFCAGMLYSLIQGYAPQQSLELANLAAAANLAHSNSVDGMLPLAGLMALKDRFAFRDQAVMQ